MYSQKRNAGESFGLDRRQATRSTCGCGGGLPLELFAKILYAQGVSFESLVAVRAFVGWLAVIGFLLLRQGARSLRVERRDLALLLPLGLVGIGTFYLLYFYTVRESTVGTVAILLYSALAFGSVLPAIAAHPTLDTLAGLSALSYALLLMLAVIHTTVALALYTFGIRHLGAGHAAIVATVEPVVAGILGVALLGEELSALKVLAGVALAQVRAGKARSPVRAASGS